MSIRRPISRAAESLAAGSCRAMLALVLLSVFASTALADEWVDHDPTRNNPSISAPLFVIIAYSAIWLLIAGFVWVIGQRQQRFYNELHHAAQRLQQLEAQLDQVSNSTTRGARS